MKYLRMVHWWTLVAILLAVFGVVIAMLWPERQPVIWAVGLAAITFAVLALREVET